jgi:hypothetical protein
MTHKTKGSSLFGRSQTKRFGIDEKDVPGPNLYTVPSTLKTVQKTPETSGFTNYLVKNDTLGSPEGTKQSSNNLQDNDKSALVWRRKRLPASIPKGHNIYGYKETIDGDMVPINAPKSVPIDPPKYLFSFAEKSKYEKKGFQFPKNRQRLVFKCQDTPAPNQYGSSIVINSKSNNPALMTLAQCSRITDEIILKSVKMSVPGPGAYEINDPKFVKLSEKRQSSKFGGGSKSGYLNQELVKIPGIIF